MYLNAEITLEVSAALFGIPIRFDPALTRFAVDDTIETLAYNMFIETWINDTSYERYFDACVPKECIYAYHYQFDALEILTTFLNMDPIFGIDVETIFSPYGAKYTNEIESLTRTIEIYLVEGFIRNNKNKEILISSLKQRVNINCIIERYQSVIDDIEVLQQFDLDIYMDKDLFLASMEAGLDGHDFKSIIRNLKAFNFKKLFEW
ncbi:unnamed protein product [Rotaria sp. Silwood1]|nr:unnamed protein product [Rotaria sp. Silwood1]CAF5095075.1 unnamed protein product [Rotaria sp. Silwood1]